MTFDWQNTAAIAVAVGAAGYLVRRLWRAARSKKPVGCNTCTLCGSQSDDEQLVRLDPSPPESKAGRLR